jgi:translation initiation factor IF-2
MLVATKCDLLAADAVLAMGEGIASEKRMVGFFMTSAKTGQGIDELFVEAAWKAQSHIEREMPVIVKVTAAPAVRSQSSCC